MATEGGAARMTALRARVAAPPPMPPAPARARVGVLVLLLTLGALAYSAWTLEALLPTGLSPTRAYVSELAAANQPYGTFFRTMDLVAGLLVGAAGVGGLRRRPRLPWPRARWGAAGWSGLALFGLATALDSRLPLSCAPTADAGCAERERAGLVPVTHSAHLVTSSTAMCGALVAVVALTVALRMNRAGVTRSSVTGSGVTGSGVTRSGLLVHAGTALMAAELAATVWTLTAIAAFGAGHGSWGLGIAQRLQVAFLAVWLLVLAAAILRRPRSLMSAP
ncbi:DUF998 domain-containing protein [Streptomyces sp. NPDC058001]|uniref:DUF998 domain-containing protein n=1 Tax=Streptomyces sp. NPDC058001 TaxID=3346300 RepID=UPI0036E9C20F